MIVASGKGIYKMADSSTSLLVRPLRKTDLDAIVELAYQAGSGMTNLPTVPSVLRSKIHDSHESFSPTLSDVEKGYYFFALEDVATQRVVGCSAIAARANVEHPFYSFKVTNQVLHSKQLNYTQEHKVLYRVNDYQHTSEVCALFVLPEYRHSHHGKLISRARFLFMSEYPNRFTHKIIAALRGHMDENNESPFWNSFAKNFLPIDFPHADKLMGIGQKHFIHDLLPDIPIFSILLDPLGQACIGKIQDATKPAYRLLRKEGFEYDNYIDIFDGGPILEAYYRNVVSIQKNNRRIVKSISSSTNSKVLYLISNTELDFRACQGCVDMLDENAVSLEKNAAELLRVKVGDPIRFISVHL